MPEPVESGPWDDFQSGPWEDFAPVATEALPPIPAALPQPPAPPDTPEGRQLAEQLASLEAPKTPLFERPGVLGRPPASVPEAFQAVAGQLIHPIKSTEAAIEQFTGAPKFEGKYAPPVKHVSEILELGPKIPKFSQKESKIGQAAAGAANALLSFGDFFLTPAGATSLGIGALPEVAKKAVLVEFAAGMAEHQPELLQEGVRLLQEGKTQEGVEKLASGAGATVLVPLIAKQVTAPKPPVSDGIVQFGEPAIEVESKVVPEAPKAPETPATVSEPVPPPKNAPAGAPEAVAGTPVPAKAAEASKLAAEIQSPTSIKNATVDAERAERGLPPAVEPMRRSFGTVWDEAMAKVDRDSTVQERLVQELKEKPRAVTDTEDALLLHRQVELQNEYAKSVKQLADAYDKPEPPTRREDYEAAQAKLQGISDRLLELYNVNKSVGTATARGLNARRMLANEDFTLASMELQMRAANGGAPLAEPQRIELINAQRKIGELQAKLDAAIAASAEQAPKRFKLAEKAVLRLEQAADAARGRLRERLGRTSAGVDPTLLYDLGVIGAAKIARFGLNKARFTAEMLEEFGESIRGSLDDIWQRSQDHLAAERNPTPQTIEAMADLALEQRKWLEARQRDANKRASAGTKAFGALREASAIPRALKASWDLSAVLRQGGIIGLGHPVRAARAIGPMLKGLVSERQAEIVNQQILNRPNAPLYSRGGLYLAPLDNLKFSAREEIFQSTLADKIPGVRASNRAFATYLNKLRADSFDAMVESVRGDGPALSNAELQAVGNYVNIATGRGNLGAAHRATDALTTLFWSPRLVASRFQYLLGQPLYRGTARTRTAIAKEYARMLTGLAVVYGLASLSGADIENDPRSSDFGKLRFDDTRSDPLAGLSQTSVLMSRLGTREMKTTKGQVKSLVDGKFGGPTVASEVGRFLRTKLAPLPGTALDVATGKNVVGEPVTVRDIPKQLLMPLAFNDVLKVMEEQGVPHGAALVMLNFLGWGLQHYDDTRPRKP